MQIREVPASDVNVSTKRRTPSSGGDLAIVQTHRQQMVVGLQRGRSSDLSPQTERNDLQREGRVRSGPRLQNTFHRLVRERVSRAPRHAMVDDE